MTVILNIGNTYSRAALWNGSAFEFLPRIETVRLTSAALPAGMPVVAATVVPELKQRLAGADIRFIDSRHCGCLVDFTQVDTSTLGADRVANAIALAAFHPLPAIALEVVDAERIFRGGAIAPGRRLMRHALAAGTAQLPEVPFSTELPDRIGNGTMESIRFGVDRGAIGLVRELVETAAKPYGGLDSVTVIATGGDAAFFAAEHARSVARTRKKTAPRKGRASPVCNIDSSHFNKGSRLRSIMVGRNCNAAEPPSAPAPCRSGVRGRSAPAAGGYLRAERPAHKPNRRFGRGARTVCCASLTLGKAPQLRCGFLRWGFARVNLRRCLRLRQGAPRPLEPRQGRKALNPVASLPTGVL